MEKDKIIVETGNKIIAEFMGATSGFGIYGDVFNFTEACNPTEDESAIYSIINLKYHTSWDWLLPVCKKIRHTEPPKGQFKKWEEKLEVMDNSITQNYEISEAYPFVVDIIQWFNSQTPAGQ